LYGFERASTPLNSALGSVELTDAQLSQTSFVNPQIVAYLVQQSLPGLLHHLLFGPGIHLVRPLVNDDAVRQHHRVALGAPRQANAGVEAEQGRPVAQAGPPSFVDGWTPADLDIDIVESVAKLGRKFVERPLDDTLELASLHLITL
jgi:hypothetical protein